jgi:hypothetical protein
MIEVLAGLGAGGTRAQNIHRDFFRYTSRFGVRLEPAYVDILHRRLDNHGTHLRSHAVLFPHEVFAAVYSAGDNMFQKMFLGPDGNSGLEEFWDRQRDHTWVREHPGFTTFGANTRTAIPFGVHADKGQHIQRDKLLTISWGSVMSRAPTIYSKHLFTVVPDELLVKHTTDEQLYAVLVLRPRSHKRVATTLWSHYIRVIGLPCMAWAFQNAVYDSGWAALVQIRSAARLLSLASDRSGRLSVVERFGRLLCADPVGCLTIEFGVQIRSVARHLSDVEESPCHTFLYKVWSMHALMRGTWPSHDHTGREWPEGSFRRAMSGRRLAGDYTCLFSEYRGDWEWAAETFQWRSWQANDRA